MIAPTTVYNSDDEGTVTVPRADYERLLEAAEMLSDIAAYDAVKRKLALGEEELIPAEYADRILDGEHPVRVWRNYRGLGVAELAAKAGISQAYLSQIESGRRTGAITVYKALAEALNLSLDDIA